MGSTLENYAFSFPRKNSPSCLSKVGALHSILLKMPMGKWQIELWQNLYIFTNISEKRKNP